MAGTGKGYHKFIIQNQSIIQGPESRKGKISWVRVLDPNTRRSESHIGRSRSENIQWFKVAEIWKIIFRLENCFCNKWRQSGKWSVAEVAYIEGAQVTNEMTVQGENRTFKKAGCKVERGCRRGSGAGFSKLKSLNQELRAESWQQFHTDNRVLPGGNRIPGSGVIIGSWIVSIIIKLPDYGNLSTETVLCWLYLKHFCNVYNLLVFLRIDVMQRRNLTHYRWKVHSLCLPFFGGKLFTFFPLSRSLLYFILSASCFHFICSKVQKDFCLLCCACLSSVNLSLVMLQICLLSFPLCFFWRYEKCKIRQHRHISIYSRNLVVGSWFIAYWSAICAFVLTVNFTCFGQTDSQTGR